MELPQYLILLITNLPVSAETTSDIRNIRYGFDPSLNGGHTHT